MQNTPQTSSATSHSSPKNASKLNIVINSNKWFSAVADYSLQLACAIKEMPGSELLFSCHIESPLNKKIGEENILIQNLPWYPASITNVGKCLVAISTWLKENQERDDVTFWTFEGREHTLLALHKKLFSHLWTNAKLNRVRGQAKEVKKNAFNQWLYAEATDKIVFAAQIVKERTHLALPPKKSIVQLYCGRNKTTQKVKTISLDKNIPHIDFENNVTFLTIARFDPVKGYDDLLSAFLKANADVCTQLVILGRSENIQCRDLFLKYSKGATSKTEKNPYFYLEFKETKKRIYFIDEPRKDVGEFLASSHFGVISSLGSEVICRVAVEMLFAGLPIISSDVGALKEVVNGEAGEIYDHKNANGLTTCITKFCSGFTQNRQKYEKQKMACQGLANKKFSLKQLQAVVARTQPTE